VSDLRELGERGRGVLRVYLGTAVGVGKTYAMLDEGWRRAQAGEDVVVGYWERHGRPETKAQHGGLELVPPRIVTYRDTTFEELDVAAVIARHPDVALVDELAHTNVADRRPRWQEVEDLLSAGIDVITTVNVANLDSAREYAAEVTGSGTVECVPDELVRSAQVELVDLPPDVLRQRVAAGHVYSAAQVGGALAHYFRAENLAALSQLALSWMAGTLDEEGPAIVARYTYASPRPVVIAGLSSADSAEPVIRRGAELAESADADLLVVHVADGAARGSAHVPSEHRELAQSLGGSFVEVHREDIADALAATAAEHGATAVVVARHRSRWVEMLRGSTSRRLRRRLPDVTIEVVEQA
jgi:two-component system sensor histidine kinase KdpD